MRSNLLAAIIAVVVFGGFFYFYQWRSSNEGQLPTDMPLINTSQTSSGSSAQEENNVSSATNYDECIAEGNQPLTEAPDKCLTKSGHLFIKGVIEQDDSSEWDVE